MTNLVSFHIQDPTPNWPEAVALLRSGAWVKFFQVENCSEAKSVNPTIRTIKRHYEPNQGQYWRDGINPYVGAQAWLDAFIDGTFRQHAHNVNAIESLNEEVALSKPPNEVQALIAFESALCDIWYNSYAGDSFYAHIDLVLANTAIGNDIPFDIAKLANDYGAYIGYHPYVPVRDGLILPNEKPYYSERWKVMDETWRMQGAFVKWLFTEIGAVGYEQSPNGDIHLLPNDGWKHPNVYNGNLNAYLAMLEYWVGGLIEWNRQYDRARSGTIFTSSVSSSGWDSFKINEQMKTIALHFENYHNTPNGELTEQDKQKLLQAAEKARILRLNTDAALQKAIFKDNPRLDRNIVTGEFDVVLTVGYVRGQMVESLDKNNPFRTVYWAVVGDWGNVKKETYSG